MNRGLNRRLLVLDFAYVLILINVLEASIRDCIIIAPIPSDHIIDYENVRPSTGKRKSIERKQSKNRRVHRKPRHEDMPSLNSHHRSLHESNRNKRRKLNGYKAVVDRIQREEGMNSMYIMYYIYFNRRLIIFRITSRIRLDTQPYIF